MLPSLTTTDWYDTLNGYLSPANQFNAASTFTISDSNLSDFSDAAVFVHPDRSQSRLSGLRLPVGEPAFRPAAALVGEPVDLYMYNDTISNSGQGVLINATQGD